MRCCLSAGVLTAAGLFLTLSPALAQDRLNGFFLTSPIELSEGYDSGFVAQAKSFNDYETLLAGPTMSWLRTTHRTEFSIDYQPEFEMFARYGNFDSWNHSSTMRMTHQINSRWSLVAGNSLIATTDPTRALGNSLVLLPRGRYVQDSFYGGVGYKINGTTKLDFRYDGAVNTMQLPAPITGELDHAANSISATLDKSLSSTQSISGTYAFLHFTPFNPAVSGNPTNVQVVNGTYTYNLGESTVLRAAGGFVGGPQNAVTWGVTAEHTFGRLWTAAGYERYVGFFGGLTPATGPQSSEIPFAQAETPSAVYQVVSVRAKGQVWRKFWLEVAAQRATDTGNDTTQGINSKIGMAKLEYRLTDRFWIFARADYYGQNINRFIDSPFNERRVYLGIELNVARYYRRPADEIRRRLPAEESKPTPVVTEDQAKPLAADNDNDAENTK